MQVVGRHDMGHARAIRLRSAGGILHVILHQGGGFCSPSGGPSPSACRRHGRSTRSWPCRSALDRRQSRRTVHGTIRAGSGASCQDVRSEVREDQPGRQRGRWRTLPARPPRGHGTDLPAAFVVEIEPVAAPHRDDARHEALEAVLGPAARDDCAGDTPALIVDRDRASSLHRVADRYGALPYEAARAGARPASKSSVATASIRSRQASLVSHSRRMPDSP